MFQVEQHTAPTNVLIQWLSNRLFKGTVRSGKNKKKILHTYFSGHSCRPNLSMGIKLEPGGEISYGYIDVLVANSMGLLSYTIQL